MLGDVPSTPEIQDDQDCRYPPGKFSMDVKILIMVQVHLIQMGDYHADSCAISPLAFLLALLRCDIFYVHPVLAFNPDRGHLKNMVFNH